MALAVHAGRLRRAAVVAVLAAGAGGARPARADIVYTLMPAASLGVTDNARNVPNGGLRQRDEFVTLGAAGAGHYKGPLVAHDLGLLLGYTKYFEGHGIDTLSGTLTWTSSFKLSAVLDFGLGASAGLSRTSQLDTTDLTVVATQGAVAGSTVVLITTANQNFLYQPTPRRLYSELLSVSQVRYIDAPPGLPDTTLIGTTLRGAWMAARDAFLLEIRAADSITPDDNASVLRGTFATGHTFVTQALAGWQRDYSLAWSSLLQAGPVLVFKLGGPAVLAPAGSASLAYKSRPWFATAVVSQTAAPNIYLGEATINDQALLRLALPLTRNELLFVSGFGSYLYARVAGNDASLFRLFDQFSLGASMNARFSKLPLVASVEYTVIDQRGNDDPAHPAPSLLRRTLMFNLIAILAWGRGTPPLFSGVP